MSAFLRVRSSLAFAALLAGCASNTPPRSSVADDPSSITASPIPASPAQPIDNSRRITLAANTHPLALPEFDMGAINPATHLDRMMLLLAPTPSQQAALDSLLRAQQDPRSPLFHRWITPTEFGNLFGLSDADLYSLSAWLAQQGFSIDEITPSRRLILFSGSAAEVYDAFRTPIHSYRMLGQTHLANSLDPQIPATFANIVAGIVSLHDFRRTAQLRTRAALGTLPQYSAGSTDYLFPADFATIYNLNPLYSKSISGAGVSIAIAARSNINLSDLAMFRSMAALPANSPAITLASSDPGLVPGDRDESTLDVEWSGAIAPAASVNLVVAKSTATTDGIDLAAAYIVNHPSAQIVAVSYGSCEQQMGAAELAFYNVLWQQAASEGISVFVASGDAGASGCSAGTAESGSSPAVNGLCSSPYATCVGGTEFNDAANPAQYWSAVNSAAYSSALAYIPEEVWNESALNGGAGLWSSGGGTSTVYKQPAWQSGISGAELANGMRAVPDVSLAAADHDGYFYVENNSFGVVSGTSVSTTAFAGIMALADQHLGNSQGSANPRLYALASSSQSTFHATPSGNNSVPGVPGFTATGAPYNLATGLGSPDATLLIDNWAANLNAQPPTLSLTSSAQSVTLLQGGSATIDFTVATGGSFTGPISFSVFALPPGLAASWSVNPLTTAGAGTSRVALTLTARPVLLSRFARITVTASGSGLTSSQGIALLIAPNRNACDRFSMLQPRCIPSAPLPFQ